MRLTKRLAASALAVLLMIALFAIPAFAADETTTEKAAWQLHEIINLCIFGGLVVIAAVLCIIFRKPLAKKLRVYKSEAKKVVWLSWAETKKNTWVVLVVVLACAAVICVIDVVLTEGLYAVLKLF